MILLAEFGSRKRQADSLLFFFLRFRMVEGLESEIMEFHHHFPPPLHPWSKSITFTAAVSTFKIYREESHFVALPVSHLLIPTALLEERGYFSSSASLSWSRVMVGALVFHEFFQTIRARCDFWSAFKSCKIFRCIGCQESELRLTDVEPGSWNRLVTAEHTNPSVSSRCATADMHSDSRAGGSGPVV